MSNPPTDRQMIGFAIYLLLDGILASVLPNRVMTEFGLTPERAKELADKAIEIHKKPG